MKKLIKAEIRNDESLSNVEIEYWGKYNGEFEINCFYLRGKYNSIIDKFFYKTISDAIHDFKILVKHMKDKLKDKEINNGE